jgi:hypothetical protein
MGCNSLYYPNQTPRNFCDIEVLRPADTILDQSVKRILIFIKPGLTTKMDIGKFTNRIYHRLKLNNLPAIEYGCMADKLSTSPRFEIVEPDLPIKNPAGESYNESELDSLCSNYKADACILFDSQNVDFDYSVSTFEEEAGYSVYGQILIISSYKIYFPSTKTSLTKQIVSGLLAGSAYQDDLIQAIYSPLTLISDYADQNGEEMANWISPIWTYQIRPYYANGSEELKTAKEFIKQEKWDEAFSIWRKYIHHENNSLAKQASYNTILSYEIEGKLDSAIFLAKNAYRRFHSREFSDYQSKLEERIEEKKLVLLELGITGNN